MWTFLWTFLSRSTAQGGVRGQLAGELLGISRAFAYELVARGELPVIRLGRRRLVALLALLGQTRFWSGKRHTLGEPGCWNGVSQSCT
jgi:excisionase family DNA binding protein